MNLTDSDLERITIHVAGHVRAHLGEWLAETHPLQAPDLFQMEVRERIVRVEEELR
ncbi:MAG: hypothetical protein HQL82_03405, partial [Magnetococcales bacterium]|nr:hypothetical protein [Magnetococcales bacterium]